MRDAWQVALGGALLPEGVFPPTPKLEVWLSPWPSQPPASDRSDVIFEEEMNRVVM